MGKEERQALKEFRPHGYVGRGDKYLADLAGNLRRTMVKVQREFDSRDYVFDPDILVEIAVILVEFAEDIHCELGLWKALETYQLEYFDSPLPLFVEPGGAAELTPFDSRRVQYLLWTLLPTYFGELILDPHNDELQILAETVGEFLTVRFAPMPRDSGLKKFLSEEHPYGYDVKRKLIWLGTDSYMFRNFFSIYEDKRDAEPGDLETIDDFVCQNCTQWCGLSPADILANVIELEGEDRDNVRNWRDRHFAPYRVLDAKMNGPIIETLSAKNIVNGEDYLIRMDMAAEEFRQGAVITGALAPWRGAWYWSGEQRIMAKLTQELEADLKRSLQENSCQITYRYCKEWAEIARTRVKEHHHHFVEHYGDDLIVFPDGRAMAEAEVNRIRAYNRHTLAKLGGAEKETDTPNSDAFENKFGSEILNHDRGIGVFSDPVEGVEYCVYLNDLISGMRKKGTGLGEDELFAITGILSTPSVSPNLIRRIVRDHGTESIATAFHMNDHPGELVQEFLFRRYKGQYYRTRYPSVAIYDQ
jgi:hypothetical protein